MFTIQSYIKETLLEFETMTIEGKEIKIGHSYDDVLEIVLNKVKQNPMMKDAKTTKNCITWYCSHMKQENDKHYDKRIFDIYQRAPKGTSIKVDGTKTTKSTKVVKK